MIYDICKFFPSKKVKYLFLFSKAAVDMYHELGDLKQQQFVFVRVL